MYIIPRYENESIKIISWNKKRVICDRKIVDSSAFQFLSVARWNLQEMVHIILLLQLNDNARTRSWEQFELVTDAVKFICSKYEEFLKKKNPNQPYLTYNIISLYAYIDQVPLTKFLIIFIKLFYKF